jgi:hypothetical protein
LIANTLVFRFTHDAGDFSRVLLRLRAVQVGDVVLHTTDAVGNAATCAKGIGNQAHARSYASGSFQWNVSNPTLPPLVFFLLWYSVSKPSERITLFGLFLFRGELRERVHLLFCWGKLREWIRHTYSPKARAAAPAPNVWSKYALF